MPGRKKHCRKQSTRPLISLAVAEVHRHAKAMNPDACRETMELARSLGLGLGYTAMEGAIRAYGQAPQTPAKSTMEGGR